MYTRYRDEIGTPIYDGDTVLLEDKTQGRYLGIVAYDQGMGGWCIRLTASESTCSGTGWVSMAGFAVKQLRTFAEYKQCLCKRLRHVRVSCRGYSTLMDTAHLIYAHTR